MKFITILPWGLFLISLSFSGYLFFSSVSKMFAKTVNSYVYTPFNKENVNFDRSGRSRKGSDRRKRRQQKIINNLQAKIDDEAKKTYQLIT